MADVTDKSKLVLAHVREFFAELKRGVVWREFVPRAVNVRLHRAKCDRFSSILSNSTDGCTHLYLALFTAISNNEVSRFNWLLALTEDVLSREEVQPTQIQWNQRRETIDEALLKKISEFVSPHVLMRKV